LAKKNMFLPTPWPTTGFLGLEQVIWALSLFFSSAAEYHIMAVQDSSYGQESNRTHQFPFCNDNANLSG
jgi:hypothetical protein